MTTATMSALDVAKELAAYVKATPGRLDGDHVERLMASLSTARSETPADALAAVAWAHGLLLEAANAMPGDPRTERVTGEKYLVMQAIMLAAQAIRALENTTGLAAEGFYGDRRQVN